MIRLRDRIIISGLTKLVDPLGRISYNYFDTDFRLTKSQNAANGTIQYLYDYWDNLISIRDPNNNETVYEYDSLERLTRETNAAYETATFEYDANNNLTRTVNPNGAAAAFVYNNGDMLTKIDRSGSEVDAVYQFDLPKGQLTKIVESGTGADTIIYAYDAAGRLTRESPSVNNFGDGGQLRYVYTAVGQLGKMEFEPAGYNYINYYYNSTGQLEEMMSDLDGVGGWNTYFYSDEEMRFTKVAVPYVDVISEYDAGGRLTKLNNKHNSDNYIQSYGYDDAGNRTKTTLSGVWSGTITYYYDDLYQLTREVRAGTANNYDYQYTYDAAGNRTYEIKGAVEKSYNITYDTNQLESIYNYYAEEDEVYFFYDANGNMTKKYLLLAGPNNYTDYYWDSRNLLTKVAKTVNGSTANHTFSYDALGQRNSMVSGGVTKYYAYQGLNVLWEKNASTGYYTYHINGPQAVGGKQGIISDEDSQPTYYCYDAIGNVLFTLDGNGDVAEQFVQDAFGNVIAGTASGIHLTGKEYFPQFGLYYFNARWYDPEIGRFISEDILDLTMSFNHPYLYADNNPINFYDINGYTKGGKQHKSNSDFPERLPGESKRDWGLRVQRALEKAGINSRAHRWGSFIKILKRGGRCVLLMATIAASTPFDVACFMLETNDAGCPTMDEYWKQFHPPLLPPNGSFPVFNDDGTYNPYPIMGPPAPEFPVNGVGRSGW